MSEGERKVQERRRQQKESRKEMPPPLSGKVLFIGGSTGALAAGLAVEAERRGACVALAAPATASESRADRSRGIHRFSSESLDSAAGCDLLFEAIIDRLSFLDAAAVTIAAPPIGEFDTLSLERWQQCVVTPLRRVFWLARCVIWEFLSRGNGGRLVFVTDPLLDGEPPQGSAPNEIVGDALISLSRSIAKEVGRREVVCNVVLVASGGPTTEDPLLPIVDAVLYLASEDASFVSGEALTVRV